MTWAAHTVRKNFQKVILRAPAAIPSRLKITDPGQPLDLGALVNEQQADPNDRDQDENPQQVDFPIGRLFGRRVDQDNGSRRVFFFWRVGGLFGHEGVTCKFVVLNVCAAVSLRRKQGRLFCEFF